jgi:hypothetical protein
VWTIPRRLPFYFSHLRSTHVTMTSETQKQTKATDKSAASGKQSSRKSILALSIFALALNGTAAIYTMPSFDIALPNFSGLVAELIPHQKAPTDAVVAALRDIQSTQQQQAGALQDNGSLLQVNSALLQQNTAQRQQDAATFDSLRKTLSDEQVDVKKISNQLSTLIAKVDLLQNAIAPEITSSIGKGHARNRLSRAAHKKWARQPKPVGPVSVGGSPLSFPTTTPTPEG